MQALPAFDDEDFHEGRAPLPLAALRGVATALNTLVYHTQCAAAGPAPGREDAAAARMLRRWLAAMSCSLLLHFPKLAQPGHCHMLPHQCQPMLPLWVTPSRLLRGC